MYLHNLSSKTKQHIFPNVVITSSEYIFYSHTMLLILSLSNHDQSFLNSAGVTSTTLLVPPLLTTWSQMLSMTLQVK